MNSRLLLVRSSSLAENATSSATSSAAQLPGKAAVAHSRQMIMPALP
jgi:hypothetical protein